MREVSVSQFKATCLALLEDVRKTGRPLRITKFGKPIAEVVPSKPEKKASWLGCLRDSVEYLDDDIVGPIHAFEPWDVKDPD